MINKAAIYTRLSKEDLNKNGDISESLRNQKSMLVSYVKERGWEIYDIYCDEDYSGAYSGDENIRPEFNRMIKDASKHRFDIVVCKSQSRFSRNMEVIEQYIHGKFALWGIRFIGVVDYVDTDIKGNKKSRQINSLINEWYLEDLSENIRAVYRHKMERGEFLAAFPPYGYSKDPNAKNHLVVNPKTAPIVKQIFEWNKEGYGAVKISRMLNNSNIPCPRKQQEIDGIRKTIIYASNDMGQWSAASVRDILHNQVYCGDVIGHKAEKISYKSRKRHKFKCDEWIVAKDMHEPVVSRELFNAAQQRLALRCKTTGTGETHILSGKVFCHYCGKPMQKNNSKGSYEYLRCRNKYAYSEKAVCPTPNIRIDTILNALFIDLINEYKDITLKCLEKNIAGLLTENNCESRNRAARKKLQDEMEQLNRMQKILYKDRLNEVITIGEYISWNKELSEKREFLLNRFKGMEEELKIIADGTTEYEQIQNKLSKILHRKSVDREIIENLVDRIEFGEINKLNGTPILKIYWAWN